MSPTSGSQTRIGCTLFSPPLPLANSRNGAFQVLRGRHIPGVNDQVGTCLLCIMQPGLHVHMSSLASPLRVFDASDRLSFCSFFF